MEQKTETIITYETLFEILRREKGRPELQKLEASFFHQVVQYLREKKNLMMANPSESLKNQHQYENIKKLLRDIYERREKKILSLALDKSRTDTSVIDLTALLPEERKLYDEAVSLFNRSRQGILLSLFEMQHPGSEHQEAKTAGDKAEGKKEEPAAEKPTKMIRFLSPVPKFLGKELETYGPFDEDDIANLPAEIAAILINKGRVEEIEEG